MSDDFETAVRAALDDVLLPLGFLPAQVSEGYAVWCAAKEELLQHAPHLADALAEVPERGGCVDVIVATAHGELVFGGELAADLGLDGRTRADALSQIRRTLEERLAPPGAR